MLDIIQVVFLGVAVIVGYLVCVPVKHDPREPPVVHSSIPVIGHFIGLIRYGSSYFSMLVYVITTFLSFFSRKGSRFTAASDLTNTQ